VVCVYNIFQVKEHLSYSYSKGQSATPLALLAALRTAVVYWLAYVPTLSEMYLG